MKKIVMLAVIIFTISLLSCNSVEPVEDTPGRRDYEWTVDTIQIFSNNILSIWGSSPEDIWGVGPGGALSTTIWHYDGIQWKTDGVVRNLSPECVHGFARNDVWIAGKDGKIWHYDGNNWTQNYQHTISGFTGISFYDLYGTSSHDLYAVGTVWFDNETRRGIILHYDGNNWKQEYLADFNSLFLNVRVREKRCFVHCIKQDVQYNSKDTTVFYEFDGKELKEIYSDKDKLIKGGWVSAISRNIFFSIYDGIYKYVNNTLEKFLKLDIHLPPGAILGRNEKDIFLSIISGQYGIYHYDGNDIKLLEPIDNGWFYDWAIFDNDVFFLVTIVGSSDSYIYHGQLK